MASPDGLEYVDLGDQGDFFGFLMGSSLDALSEHWYYYREVDHGEGTGFIFQRSDTGRGDRVGVPYWFACIVGLVAPVLWTVRRRRRMVKFRSDCPICGYDLRATPDRCPECGTVTDTASQTD